MMLNLSKTIPMYILIALAAMAIGIFAYLRQDEPVELPRLGKAIILPVAKAISGVDFTDHNGKPFTSDRLMNKWSILFFGFTNCPDICPTAMHTLRQVKDKLSSAGKWGNYQVIMVSVDPARDNPEQLSRYVPFFDSEFIGITSDLQTTEAFARQLGILFVAHTAGPDGSYDVDHGTAMILMNPMAEMAGIIGAPHQADKISTDLIALANFYAEDHVSVSVDPGLHTKTAAASLAGEKPHHQALPNKSEAVGDNKINGLRIANAWIRPAPPTVTSMAGYLDLINDGTKDIIIVEVESPKFGSVMIHDTLIEKGVASMQHKDSLLVPAGGQVSLAPLATHLMMMSPEIPIPQGSVVEIMLTADDGRTLLQDITVMPEPGAN